MSSNLSFYHAFLLFTFVFFAMYFYLLPFGIRNDDDEYYCAWRNKMQRQLHQ